MKLFSRDTRTSRHDFGTNEKKIIMKLSFFYCGESNSTSNGQEKLNLSYIFSNFNLNVNKDNFVYTRSKHEQQLYESQY